MTDTRNDGAPSSRAAVAPGAAPRFGRFRYDVATGRLVWSEKLYEIFGLAPSEVVPTFAVMSSHQHPDDRDSWDQAIDRALREATTFSRWHRIIDTSQRVHAVLSIGYVSVDGDGKLIELSGFVVDMTRTLRRDREQEATRAVLESAATRDLIEQAKGMLMVIFDLTDAQAFDLLRWHSSYTNTKLREVAATLVDRLVDPQLAGLAPRQRLTAILSGLKGGKPVPPTPEANTVNTVDASKSGDERPKPSTKRIATADLPRTMVRAVSVATQSISIADWLLPDQPLVYVNPAFEKLTGYNEAEILGRNCRFLQGADTDPRTVTEIRAALSAGREVRCVLRNYRRDGTPFWNELHLSPVRDDAGRITHYIGYQVDVSERVEREHQLLRLAYSDADTGLPNEASAVSDLDAGIRTAGGATVTALYVAVKAVSEDYQDAESGRWVLATAAGRIRSALPSGQLSILNDRALLVRLPGDAADFAAAVQEALTEPLSAEDGDVVVEVRVGSSRFPADGSNGRALINAARTDAGRTTATS